MTTPIYNMTDNWTDAAVVYKSIQMTVTDTLYAAGSKMFDISSSVAGGSFTVDVDGNLVASGTLSVAGGNLTVGDDGDIHGAEQAVTSTAVPNYWSVYSKTDDSLYYQDGAGAEHLIHPLTVYKSYSMVSRQTSSGIRYIGGYYQAPAADANLTNASATQNYGTANSANGAHVFVVAGGAGSTDGSDLVLTVSGTSVTDAGVRTPADTEVIVADCTAVALDEYYETAKKFIGTIVLTLTSTGGATFAFDFNYGLCKYEDFGNKAFTLTDIEFTGYANATDSGFDISVIHHKETGWTYSAAAFVPGPAASWVLSTDYVTERSLIAGQSFAYKRSALATAVNGAGNEGIIIKVLTTTNAALAYLNGHVGVTY